MTIFGFNTDVRVEETVYHIQTEVRSQERRLESQVFVSGRCIGKRSMAMPQEHSEETAQELARNQHRWVVEAVREGFIDDVLNQDAGGTLVVQFLGAQRLAGNSVQLQFRVLTGGEVAVGAEIHADWKTASEAGELLLAITDDAGEAHMSFILPPESPELLVRATYDGREARRRFIIKSQAAAGVV
ncbi:MAG: hypothetical protein P4M01_09775 [Acidobacteriota bacterium]|nr:hypothetical protein [Acidobacteriota bacterium]